MAVEIKMPQLSDTMHAGKILTWLKKEGDTIIRGDILAEVETDKANLQIESFHQGVLLKIVTPANQNATVGDVIAYIGAAGESVGTSSSSASTATAPAAKPAPVAIQQATSSPSAAAAPVASLVAAEAEGSLGRVKASPLAKKLAEQRNVDLSVLRGSGPQGRIIKKDVESAGGMGSVQASPSNLAAVPSPYEQARHSAAEAAAPGPVAQGSAKLTPFSKMRDTIARRMQESVREAPHFYVTTSINMREAQKLREILKEQAEYKGLSLNHLIIKAAAYAIEKEPRVNRAVRDNQTCEPASINIGIITAIEDGLLIPVIKDANRLSLRDVCFEARAAVERARAGRPSSTDLTGGTFSISNMGMFDVENFTAIINPGQGAVLAVSSLKEEPVVENGNIVAGIRMKVTISVDHRIIDGVMAGTFLKFFKQALETPALMFT